MKIIKRIEDIQPNMWCRATKENFNALRELGLDSVQKVWKEISDDPSFLSTDILFIGNNTIYFYWNDYDDRSGDEFTFNQEPQGSLLSRLEFLEPETFKVEILKIFGGVGFVEYIGTINECIPAKWNSEGICLIPSEKYNLYKEYKQKIYTKPNSHGFHPKQKFKISWTENMSQGLEQSGWKLATNEQIEGFKL